MYVSLSLSVSLSLCSMPKNTKLCAPQQKLETAPSSGLMAGEGRGTNTGDGEEELKEVRPPSGNW